MPTPIFSTADTIMTQARSECGIGSNPPSTAVQNTALLRALNDVNHEYTNYPLYHGMLGWKYLMKEIIIETKANTTLNGAILSGASSLILTSGTDFDSPSSSIGAGYIKSGKNTFDFFAYETKSTHTLSVVSGIQMDHTTLSKVHKIYKLPDDFGKVRNVFRASNSVEFFHVDEDFTQIPTGNRFMVKVMNSTNYSGSFIVFREDISTDEFMVRYQKAPTTIDETTDKVDAPNGTGRRFIVEKLKSYIWGVLGEESEIGIALQKANVAIDQCATEWAVHHIQPNQSLRFYF